MSAQRAVPRTPVRSWIPLAVVLGSCASPLGGEDLELWLGASALPGAGVVAGLSQRLWQGQDLRVDYEMDLLHQELSDAGPSGDDEWDQIRAGLRLRPPSMETPRWSGRAGAVWLRSQGETGVLEEADDYGGVYAGAGLDFDIGPALATGPDLSLLYVDAESDRGGSGLVSELAWRLVWRL